ncbi:3175_t:CDS:1, partial [Gigaspora rosea]
DNNLRRRMDKKKDSEKGQDNVSTRQQARNSNFKLFENFSKSTKELKILQR